MINDTLSRRDLMVGGGTGLLLWASTQMAKAQGEPVDPTQVCVLVGPTEDGEPVRDPNGNLMYFTIDENQSRTYYTLQEDDEWTHLPLEGGDSPWVDDNNDGFLQAPGFDGIDVPDARAGRVEVGWAGLDSIAEEEDEFSTSSSGTQTIEFQHTYRVASPAVGANEGDGSASWFGWIRDENGHITGMEVDFDTGMLSSIDVKWHVIGNQTEDSYNEGAE